MLSKKEYDKKRYKKNRKIYLERSEKYRKDNPEYIKKYHKEYYIKNRNKLLKKCSRYIKTENGKATDQRGKSKRRAIMRSIINTLTAEEWVDILKEYKFRCVYCGKEFNLFDKPTRDHVMPISKGGHNIKENVVPAGLWFKEEGHLWNAGEDIFMDFELIYCPICGKKIKWEGN